MTEIAKLIEEYEIASGRMAELITQCNLPDCEIQSVDRILDRAFDELLNANADCKDSLIAHCEYLLKLIKTMYPDDNILALLVDRIHRDIVHLDVKREWGTVQ